MAALAAVAPGSVVNGPANTNFNFTIAEQPDMLFNPEIFPFSFALPAAASFGFGTLVLCEPGQTCTAANFVNWSDEIQWNGTNGGTLISDGSPFVTPAGVFTMLPEIGPEGSNGAIYTVANGNGGTVTWTIFSDVPVPEPGTLTLLATSILGFGVMLRRKTLRGS
jgi:hypothetical protein